MEEDVFLKKMKGVIPIKKEQLPRIKKKETSNKKKPKKKLEKFSNTWENLDQTKIKKNKLNLSFGEINKDLKRGRVKIDRRIDLHGHTLLSAYEKFKAEVIKSFNNNKRCLLFITGKGVRLGANSNSQEVDTNKPRLFYGKIKNSIINWIKEEDIQKYVLTYQDAGFEHGGDGAIFVYLRKKRN